jgi:hypothetical protein
LSEEFRQSLKQVKDQPFGDGSAAERMVKVLKTVALNKALFEKRISY